MVRASRLLCRPTRRTAGAADRAALESLSSVRAPADVALIHSVVKALYEPWLDASARHFQARVDGAESVARAARCRHQEREGRVRLLRRRAPLRRGRHVEGTSGSEGPASSARTSPFATADRDCNGQAHSQRLFTTPSRAARTLSTSTRSLRGTNQAVTAQRLRDEMAKRGFDLLGDEVRPPEAGSTGAWVETGRLDELGHKIGAQVAAHLETELETLVDQIIGLLECGWLRIRVVTDHGWLLLPGGLPRVDLPPYLAATKWARCATVKGDSKPEHADLLLALERPRPDRVAAGHRLLHGEQRVRARRRQPAGVHRPRAVVERGRRVHCSHDHERHVAWDAMPRERDDE